MEEVLIQQENSQELFKAIAQLPEQKRDLIYMKYVLDMSIEEIAQQFGVKPASVRVYLHRIRQQAKSMLRKEHVEDEQ